MEELTDILGKKIAALCEHIKQLKGDNTKLAEDNAQLQIRIRDLEKSLEADHEYAVHEKNLTKVAIDELIESIDLLIGKECQEQ